MIQDWYFLKGNSIIYNFFRIRENQISMFSRPKIHFKLLLKIVTFFEHFWKFSYDVSVSLSYLLFKKLSSEAKGRDKHIRQAWTDLILISIWNFEEKIEDDAEFVLSFALVSYFCHNILYKIPIDLGLMCFERKFNSLQFFQKYRKPNFNFFQAKNAI